VVGFFVCLLFGLVALDARPLILVPHVLHLTLGTPLHLPGSDCTLDGPHGVPLLGGLLQRERVTREGDEILQGIQSLALFGAGLEVEVRLGGVVAPESHELAFRHTRTRVLDGSRVAELVNGLAPLGPLQTAAEVATAEERDLAPLPGREGCVEALVLLLRKTKDLTLIEPRVGLREDVVLLRLGVGAERAGSGSRRNDPGTATGADESLGPHEDGVGDELKRLGECHF
jgi:hypothetical protein